MFILYFMRQQRLPNISVCAYIHGNGIKVTNDFDVQNDIATVEVVQKPPLLSRPMVIKGKRKKKSLTEPPGVSNSNDLALRDHQREPRVIEDPD